jgi:hypothetical protein
MKSRPLALLTCCSTSLFLLTTFELDAHAAAVETVGELKTSEGIRLSDNSLQISACTGCAGGILTVPLGGPALITPWTHGPTLVCRDSKHQTPSPRTRPSRET